MEHYIVNIENNDMIRYVYHIMSATEQNLKSLGNEIAQQTTVIGQYVFIYKLDTDLLKEKEMDTVNIIEYFKNLNTMSQQVGFPSDAMHDIMVGMSDDHKIISM